MHRIHYSGPTLILTRLPDGGLTWTVIQPQAMSVTSDWHGISLKIEGQVMTGDWRYGPPPTDWEAMAMGELPSDRAALASPEVHRLPPGEPR